MTIPTRWNTPTRENRKRRSTRFVRDDFMYTVDGLRQLHTRMEAQRASVAAKLEGMSDGKEKVELSLMLLAFVNKQSAILDQIADMQAKTEIRQAKLAGDTLPWGREEHEDDDLPF